MNHTAEYIRRMFLELQRGDSIVALLMDFHFDQGYMQSINSRERGWCAILRQNKNEEKNVNSHPLQELRFKC